MRSLLYRHGKINRWLAILLPSVIAFSLLLITLLGTQLHRILARLAGEIIGEIKDNLAVVVAVSVLCVAGVWVFIVAKCWAEGREGKRAGRNEPGPE
jgi:ABC-type Mn2+/Zn2+ transport system permease subunit